MIITPYKNIPFSVKSGFNPLSINGLGLYLNKKNATVSSWIDQSPNAFNFEQATETKQPTIETNSVDYDGTDDFQQVLGTDLLNYTSGYYFFSGYADGTTQYYLCSADKSVENKYVYFRVTSGGAISVGFTDGTADTINSTNTIVNGDYFYAYIKWNNIGDPYVLSLNGVIETNIVAAGGDNGKGFGHLSGRDDLTLSSIDRLSQLFATSKQNKTIISNAALTSDEIAEINTFMSDPNN